MSTSRVPRFGVSFAFLCICLLITAVVPATAADHVPSGEDTLVFVSGIFGFPLLPAPPAMIGPIEGTQHDDDIAVENGQTLMANGQGSVAGIEARGGDDDIANRGTIEVEATAARPRFQEHEAPARAVGIAGGDGDDDIDNEGTVSAHALADGGAFLSRIKKIEVVGNAVGIDGGNGDDTVHNSGTVDATAEAMGVHTRASATGIDGGEGDDALRNEGEVTADAVADSNAVLFDTEPAKAEAAATGIEGGEGDDAIESESAIRVTGTAAADSGEVVIHGLGDFDTSATSAATGIDGGSGSDTIMVAGSSDGPALQVEATSTANAFSVAADSIAVGLDHAGTNATSTAVGVSGGDGNDAIGNSGGIEVGSTSDTRLITVQLQGRGLTGADAGLHATSQATGIDGGAGDDEITSEESVTVSAGSTLDVFSFQLATKENKGNGQTTEGDKSKIAESAATGIDGGEGNDQIDVSEVDASSAASTDVNEVKLTGSYDNKKDEGSNAGGNGNGGSTPQDAVAPSDGDATLAIPFFGDGNETLELGTGALASTVGVAGGGGDDVITIHGPVTATAAADTVSRSVEVGVKVQKSSSGASSGGSGNGGNAPAGSVETNAQAAEPTTVQGFDAQTLAQATATAVSGGDGNDAIVNLGDVTGSATATSSSLDVEVGVDVEKKASGSGSGSSGSSGGSTATAAETASDEESAPAAAGNDKHFSFDSSTVAAATAAGIDGGDGNDTIVNQGAITADSTSDASTVSVGVTVESSTGAQFSELKDLFLESDSGTASVAMSSGVAGGAGNDAIDNQGAIAATSNADVSNTAVGITLSGEGGKLALSSTVARANKTAAASASGIEGDSGSDVITNSGSVSSMASSSAESLAITLEARGEVDGAGLSVALSDAKIEASSSAVGIDGGADDDTITSTGAINASADAGVTAGSVAVDGGLGGKFSIGAALARTDATATAAASGIDGGAGDDDIDVKGTVNSTATTSVDAASVAVTFQSEAKGAGLSGALADTPAAATSTSTAIRGGDGDDRISSDAKITSTATADVSATTAALDVSVGEKGFVTGLALARAGSTATATALGLDGGAGEDEITASDQIDAVSDASANAVAVSAAIEGVSQGAGLSGALVDAATEADATAKGIDAGEGDDDISSDAKITAQATSDADAVGVAVDLSIGSKGFVAGAAVGRTDTISTARATGIDGGTGNDVVAARGEVSSEAKATGSSVSVGVDVQGASQGAGLSGALSLADNTTLAEAMGISGGDGDDVVETEAKVKARAESDATAVGVAVDGSIASKGFVGGAALARASVDSTARATAIDGGTGRDRITAGADVESEAEANADAVSVSLAVQGAVQGGGLSGALLDAPSGALAVARGVDGGDGDDEIETLGAVSASAQSDADAVGVGADLSVANQGAVGGVTLGRTETTSTARATGVDGGAGNDSVRTLGTVDSQAEATGTSVGVNVAIQGAVQGGGLSGALSLAGNMALAEARGVDGGDGDDEIETEAEVKARAESDATAVGVAVDGSVASQGFVGGAGLARASVDSTARATAIDGGTGHDAITAGADVESEAVANADAVSVSLAVQGAVQGGGLSGALLDAPSGALAVARGVDGGDGDDEIETLGAVSASAQSDADAVGVGADLSVASQGAVGGVTLGRTETTSTARATGVDGGAGNDSVTTHGTVDSQAEATGTSVGVNVAIQGAVQGGGLSGALSLAGNTALAEARGVDGGEGDDEIETEAKVKARAESDATAVGVSVDGSIASQGLVVGVGLARASVDSTARATAIDGGTGRDGITAGADVESEAVANADAVSVSLAVQGAMQGGGVSGALLDAPSEALAVARGVDGGDGDDDIETLGAVSASAQSDAGAVGVGADLSVAVQGAVGGVALGRTDVTSTARATGIDGGGGDDTVHAYGAVSSDATASATGVSVDAAVQGAVEGVGVSGAASLSDTTARATALGIDGGDGDDTITTDGPVTATALADANATAVGVHLGIAVEGAVLGASLSKTDVEGDSEATGLGGGAGDDTIATHGDVDASATTDVASAAVSVALEGTFEGGVASATLADAPTTGTATATGVDGGEGDDDITTAGDVTSTARTEIDSAAVSTDIGIGVYGFAGGGAMSRTTTNAEAIAIGVDGGEGDDHIDARGDVSADATTDVTTASVAISIQGSLGVGLAGALSDASTIAGASSTGIAGGEGDDDVSSAGSVSATSLTDVTSASVAVDLPIAVGAGVSLARLETEGVSEATGIDGGSGDDAISNLGTVMADSTTDATGWTLTASILGASIDDASTTGTALACGLAGGIGDDSLANEGDVTAGATSNATAVSVTLNLAGAAVGDASTTADAGATGIAGGSGDGEAGDGRDTIVNDGRVTADAEAGTTAVGVTFNEEGAAVTDASSTATANSGGIVGGAGGDSIINHGDVTSGATAHASAVAVTFDVPVTGGIGASVGNASTTALASAYGIDGGAGDDSGRGDGDAAYGIVNDGTVDVQADARATAVDVTLRDGGASISDGSAQATAVAAGLTGGSGADALLNRGDVSSGATSRTAGVDVTFTVVGAAIDDLSTEASATAVGMAGDHAVGGGDGDDKIVNEGSLTATSSSESEAVGVTFSVAGAAIGDDTSTAVAHSAGIEGGGGQDDITHSGTILSTAMADAGAVGVTVAEYGAAIGDASTHADADATGIDGGAGEDAIGSDGIITAHADSNARSASVSVAAAGAAIGDVSANAVASAAGITAGDGDGAEDGAAQDEGGDEIRNSGTITATADADSRTVSVNVTVAGASIGDSSSRSIAQVSGITGGSASDDVLNDGSIVAHSTSTASSPHVSVSVAGAAIGKATTEAQALASGIGGGAGDDTLDNVGAISSRADADVTSGGVNVSVAGASLDEATASAAAASTGMDGGAGDDDVSNSGTITATSDAQAESTGVSVNLAGAALTKASVNADADATGIAGGAGADRLFNDGSVTATSTANAPGTSVNITIAGAAHGTAETTASARAAGLDGGDDDDVIENAGTVSSHATSTSSADDVSVVPFGAATGGADSAVLAQSSADGIRGGGGNDTILNSAGEVEAVSTSNASSDGISVNVAGFAASGIGLSAVATSSGITGEDGDDDIVNDAMVRSTSTSTVTPGGTSVAVFGASDASPVGSATSYAAGLLGGAGNDHLANGADGTIVVTAHANGVAQGSGFSIAGAQGNSAALTATSAAVGIDAGDGNDAGNEDDDYGVRNEGSLQVNAHSTVDVSGSSWTLAGVATSGPVATGVSFSTGIAGGQGTDSILNASTGTIDVSATSSATAAGNSNTVFGAPGAAAKISTSASAEGVDGGAGDDTIDNEGAIDVTAMATPGVAASAGTFGGNPFSSGNAAASTTAVGIDGGSGGDVIRNTGDGADTGMVDVLAQTTVNVSGSADTVLGASTAEARAQGVASAAGIQVGGDGNTVENTGRITVVANSDVTASTDTTSSFDVDFDCGTMDDFPFVYCHANFNFGDATSKSYATAQATAVGIDVGDGDGNVVTNDGVLEVTASAAAHANATATGLIPDQVCTEFLDHEFCFDVPFGADTTEVESSSATAEAIGIRAGDGSGQITNTGTIEVQAFGAQQARAVGIETGGAYVVDNTGTIHATAAGAVATAAGIQTGAGDDVIINDGTILTTVNGVNAAGVAIDAGAGNDTVILGDGSTTDGAVRLGDGDDGLVFGQDAQLTGAIFGGDGYDSVDIEDTSTHFLNVNDVERLAPNSGVIVIDGDLAIPDSGGLGITVNGENGGGRLEVAGGGSLTLGGTVDFSAGAWAYQDGQTFDFLDAQGGVYGDFGDVVLPDPSAFLDFSYDQDARRVAVAVSDFAPAATNPVEAAIADTLDAVRPTVSGDMSEVIGSFQLASTTQVADAFASLSPDTYEDATLTSFEAIDLHVAGLRQRMDLARSERIAAQDEQAAQGRPWFSGMGRWGGRDSRVGYGGGDYRIAGLSGGWDRAGARSVLGVAGSRASTRIDFDAGRGNGGITSYLLSGYAGRYGRRYTVHGSVTYGLDAFEGSRFMSVGPLRRVARSDHDGQVLSGALDAGLSLGSRRWNVEPLAGLRYVHLHEAGFEDTAAGDAGLAISPRNTTSLVSEVGLRVGRKLERQGSQWLPEVTFLWEREHRLGDRSITAAFLGALDNPFTIAGREIDRSGLIVGAGLTYVSERGLATSVRYVGHERGDSSSHGITIDLGFAF